VGSKRREVLPTSLPTLWPRDRGCTELASDAALDNAASRELHKALKFEETERVVFFRKAL
jgi:aminoglycoside 6'-N-acetyltransferase I